MDIATIVGFIAFIIALMVGIGTHVDLVFEAPLLIVVFGGGLALTVIALPLSQAAGLGSAAGRRRFQFFRHRAVNGSRYPGRVEGN